MFLARAKNLLTLVDLKTAFNHKNCGIVCIIIAVAAKSLIAWAYSDLEADKSLYLLLAKGFIETGVFAEPVRLADGGRLIYLYNSAILSPFYSLLAVPFLWLTQSFLATQFIISVVGWVLFFTALAKIAQLIFKEQWLANVFILFSAFFLYPHELASTPKDTLAAAFTLWSIFFIYQLSQGKTHLKTSLGCAVSIACLCFTKLIYVPAGLVLIVLLSVFVFKQRRKQTFTQWTIVLSLSLLVVFMIWILVIRPAQHGIHATPASVRISFIRGFYPNNLLQAFPFISSSVIDTNFLSIQVSRITHLSYSTMMQAFQVIDGLLLITLLSLLFLHYGKVHFNKVLNMLITAAFVLAGLIIYLSLTYQAFHFNYNTSWTYVADARSFLIPMIVLQLLLFAFFFQYSKASWLRKALIILFVFGFAHGIYFTAKQITHLNKADVDHQVSSPVKKTISKLSQLEKKGEEVDLITSDEILRRYAEIKGIKVYAIAGKPANLTWMSKQSDFLVATQLEDSLLRNKLQLADLKVVDTIKPFVLQIYTAR